LFAAADQAGIDLTLFHGQGDVGSRGGGRTEVLVRGGPDGARRGRLRITEQGELINEKYGLRPIALRIFEQAFNALTLSRAGVIAPEHVDPKWRAALDLLGEESSRVYRATVYEDAQFADFFREVSPIDAIERMQIGSRPTSRTETSGIEALRSIPWMHAWSQCRYSGSASRCCGRCAAAGTFFPISSRTSSCRWRARISGSRRPTTGW
jgi:phosphoenolpyruvate carboxylase